MANEIQDQLEPWSRLDGITVMVTGASSGLGLELCLDLAKAGCRIVAAARRIERLESLCEQINKMDVVTGGGSCRAIAVELDITAEAAAVGTAVEKAWNAFGHVDALINNAGVTGQMNSSLKLPENEWNRIMKTNLTGSWLVSRHIGARMRGAGRGGSIVNITSTSGLNRPQFHGGVAYGSSKAGLHSITKIMALELGEHDIRVNAIAPGMFESEITKDLFEKKWLKNVEKKTVPLGTFLPSNPAMTSIVRYLLHNSSSYITGNIFIVDAGYSLPGLPIYSSL